MMAISDIDREQFRRATDRLKASELDALTQESSYDALTAAEAMLVEPSDHNTATAVAKLTLFLAHFASGSPKAAANAATKAVDEHEKNCAFKNTNIAAMPWSGVLKMMALKAPYAFAIIAGVAILSGYAEKILVLFAN